jgi:hypothetical protein
LNEARAQKKTIYKKKKIKKNIKWIIKITNGKKKDRGQ